MEIHENNSYGQAEEQCGVLVLWEWLLPCWVMARHAPNLHLFPQNEVLGEYVK